jgi:ribosomal protein L44E
MRSLYCSNCNKITNHYIQEWTIEDGSYDLMELDKVLYFICSECNTQHQSFENTTTLNKIGEEQKKLLKV